MDILTHIDDLNLFRAECMEKAESGNTFFTFNGDDISYNISKIPVRYNGLKSVCLVRLTTDDEIEEFESLTSVENIGSHTKGDEDYTFKDGGKDKYDSVYGEDQQQVALMIGVFA